MDKEYTFGGVETLSSVPTMTYTTSGLPTQIRVEFVGRHKIQAIKAVRYIFGLSLKAAKDLIEWEGGFMVSHRLFQLIQNEYMTNPPPEADILDWRAIKQRPEPIWLLKDAG